MVLTAAKSERSYACRAVPHPDSNAVFIVFGWFQRFQMRYEFFVFTHNSKLNFAARRILNNSFKVIVIQNLFVIRRYYNVALANSRSGPRLNHSFIRSNAWSPDDYRTFCVKLHAKRHPARRNLRPFANMHLHAFHREDIHKLKRRHIIIARLKSAHPRADAFLRAAIWHNRKRVNRKASAFTRADMINIREFPRNIR